MPINPNATNDGKPYLKAHDDVMTLAGATLPPARPVKPTAPPPSKPVGNNGDFPYSMPIDGNVSIPDSGVMSTASQPPARPIGKPIAPPPSKPVVNNGNFPYSEPIYGKRTSTTPVSVMTTADVPPAYNPNNAVAKPQYTVKNSVRVADADNLKNKEILFVIDRIEGKGERVIRERRINQIELFSLNTEDGKGKGLLTVGKIPTASGNVFFGEWAPASEAAATAHVKGNAHPAWFYGKNPTGSTKGLATATYNVVGVNGHKAGERDIYTGTVKAYFGSGDSGSMTGKLARHTDTLDFAGVKIDNRNGTFASDAARNREGIKGQFYGQNAVLWQAADGFPRLPFSDDLLCFSLPQGSSENGNRLKIKRYSKSHLFRRPLRFAANPPRPKFTHHTPARKKTNEQILPPPARPAAPVRPR